MSEPTRNVVEPTTNSATEELRRLLDERGVEHYDAEDGHTQHTWWSDGDHEICASTSGMRLAVYNVTPEQAIAATLGPGTCHVEGYDDGIDEGLDGEPFAYAPPTWYLSCGHEVFGSERPCYCATCGRKVIE